MILTVIIILASALIDQISKYLVLELLVEKGSVTVIPHVLDLTYVENRGAAFGILQEHRWVFMVISVVAIALILFYIGKFKPQDKLTVISLALIAGGGVGNMIDRVFRGFVVDFIEATFVKFYVFNIADSCVTVGCVLLIIAMIVAEVRERRGKAMSSASENNGNE